MCDYDISESLIDEIAETCINLYNNLPKTGKPVENQWTVLSCIVQYDMDTKTHEVVALGTGSKCVGASKMSSQGNILNDSHAEIIARRGFLLYLYENIINVIEDKFSIFIKHGNRFLLKNNIEFIFYSSQMPCGDASIILKTGDTNDIGDLLSNSKRQCHEEICDIESKRIKLDIYRTGAKCLSNNQQDSREAGQHYHITGQVRTKPGRGDKTLSVSCSDKMARWIHVGIEGCLLNLLLHKPIFIKHFIIGSGRPYSETTLKRALLQRECNISVGDRLKVIPEFHKSAQIFMHICSKDNSRPAAGSIIWVKTKNRLLEVAVQGKKLGVTKKNVNDVQNCLSISKYKLYEKFLEVLHKSESLKEHVCGKDSVENIAYNVMKKKALQYQTHWNKIKEIFFKSWTLKPDIWNFCINKRVP